MANGWRSGHGVGFVEDLWPFRLEQGRLEEHEQRNTVDNWLILKSPLTEEQMERMVKK